MGAFHLEKPQGLNFTLEHCAHQYLCALTVPYSNHVKVFKLASQFYSQAANANGMDPFFSNHCHDDIAEGYLSHFSWASREEAGHTVLSRRTF